MAADSGSPISVQTLAINQPLTILGPSDRRMVVGGLQDADSRQQLWWARVAEMATGEVPQVAKPVATDLPAPSPEPPPVLPEVQGCECTCEELASINAFLGRMQNTKDPAALMSLSQSPMLEKTVCHMNCAAVYRDCASSEPRLQVHEKANRRAGDVRKTPTPDSQGREREDGCSARGRARWRASARSRSAGWAA